MPIALDGIAPLLQVQDMARSVAFYRGMLDFQVVASTPRGAAHPRDYDWCMLAQGEIAIMLARVDDPGAPVDALAPVELVDDGAPTRPLSTYRIALYFGHPDIDRLHGELRARGCPVPLPLTTVDGMRQLRVLDPDGFLLCVQHPA